MGAGPHARALTDDEDGDSLPGVLVTPDRAPDGTLLDELAITMEAIAQLRPRQSPLALVTRAMLAQLSAAPLAALGRLAKGVDPPVPRSAITAPLRPRGSRALRRPSPLAALGYRAKEVDLPVTLGAIGSPSLLNMLSLTPLAALGYRAKEVDLPVTLGAIGSPSLQRALLQPRVRVTCTPPLAALDYRAKEVDLPVPLGAIGSPSLQRTCSTSPLAALGYRAKEVDLPVPLGAIGSPSLQRALLQPGGLAMYALGALRLTGNTHIAVVWPGTVLLAAPPIPPLRLTGNTHIAVVWPGTVLLAAPPIPPLSAAHALEGAVPLALPVAPMSAGDWTVALTADDYDPTSQAMLLLRPSEGATDAVKRALQNVDDWLLLRKSAQPGRGLPTPRDLMESAMKAALGASSVASIDVQTCASRDLPALFAFLDVVAWCAARAQPLLLQAGPLPCQARAAAAALAKQPHNASEYPCGPARYRLPEGAELMGGGSGAWGARAAPPLPRTEDARRAPLLPPQPAAPVTATDADVVALQHFWLVNKRHKLLYLAIPKVACTQMIQLFLRAVNATDWDTDVMANIHFHSGNKRIRAKTQVTAAQLTAIMNDPQWTRAVVLREPRRRVLSLPCVRALFRPLRYPDKLVCGLLSPRRLPRVLTIVTNVRALWRLRDQLTQLPCAYLDKYVLHGSYGDRVRADKRYVSFHEFVEVRADRRYVSFHKFVESTPVRVRADKRYVSFHEFVESTQVDTGMRLARRRTGAHPLSTVDPHHRPQALFMDKFLPYMNFIAEYTQVQHHVREMLEKVGMWEQYGASGWGRDKQQSGASGWGRNKQQAIYQPNSNTVQRHSTNSEALHELFYTPEIEQMVMRSYAIDYDMFPGIAMLLDPAVAAFDSVLALDDLSILMPHHHLETGPPLLRLAAGTADASSAPRAPSSSSCGGGIRQLAALLPPALFALALARRSLDAHLQWRRMMSREGSQAPPLPRQMKDGFRGEDTCTYNPLVNLCAGAGAWRGFAQNGCWSAGSDAQEFAALTYKALDGGGVNAWRDVEADFDLFAGTFALQALALAEPVQLCC
ncbi:hypothetical protein JKP88DRAFT_349089 [Tribonema minus]|uniref:Uncharacterized protein n=1 Tax=Tribonema minus TaxID=303371 RepID=A0A835YWJ0_9STRA|nr:hypothetical protein JKP88DRAFT_349089 [Tribonema minus]